MQTDTPPLCVFCGNPIRPDQEAAGRAPMAAHAACADAALASDDHWEAIDAAGEGDASGGPAPAAGRAGCLGTALALVALAAAAWFALRA